MTARPDPADLRQRALLRAAAVLWQFEPAKLQPEHVADGDGEPREAAPPPATVESLVLPFVVRLRTPGGDRWTLRDALRPALLRGADGATLARLRACNATTGGREQQLVDRWLAGPDPALATYDCEALAVLERIVTWFDPVPPHFPSTEQLGRLRALAHVREPLLELAGPGVHGRAPELGRLHAFVEAPPDAAAPAILVVHGVGGVGKSTLTAQLLLDVLASGDPSHLVAYLDFDHPTLDVRDGLTLMLEILRQGATQRPDHVELQDLVRCASQATVDLSAGRGHASGRALAVRASMAELAAASGQVLQAAGVTRVTLVLDTFEDTQYGNPDHERQLVEQLAILHASLPGLHTIVISRVPLALPGAQQLELTDLGDDAARRFLGAQGVHDEAIVRSTLQAARGNPLSLKLVTRAGDQALRAPGRRDAREHALIHGQLYQRILQHVHDAALQPLAHPGLVVRRLTVEILQRVLAGPCGLGAIDEARASALFAQLAREVSLVRVAPDGALEHRADVRRVMLRLMYRDRPWIARQLHERAADYHRDRHDDVAIVEEAYHRLVLGETSGPWLVRLPARAAAQLVTVIDELPEAAWPIVAARAGVELSAAQQHAVQATGSDRHQAERIAALVRDRRVAAAVALVDASPPTCHAGALWRWHGRALGVAGRRAEALVALERALATLVGPADEARHDLALARALAGELGDAESLARLQAALLRVPSGTLGEPPAAPRAVPRSLAPRAPGPVQWLDDHELRAVLEAALDPAVPDAEPRGGAPGGERAPRPRSTRAASAYARAVMLNRRVDDKDKANEPNELLAWVDALSKSHRDLEAIRVALASRLPPR